MTSVAKRERRALRRLKKAIEWIATLVKLGTVAKDGVDKLRRR